MMLRMGQTPNTQVLPARRLATEQTQPVQQQLFGEVFPILTDALPALTAYRLSTRGGESTRKLGGRLAEFLGSTFGGFWVWSNGRLLTDAPPNPVKLFMSLDDARAAYPKTYQNLDALEEDLQWQPSPLELADYVVHGPVAQLEETILEALSRTVYSIKSMRVVREYNLRTWAVNNAPALSISVVSRLLYEPDLQNYMETLPKPSDIVGLWVADKTSQLQGEIVKIVGLVSEHRERLLELATRATSRSLIENAPDSHYVTRVLCGTREYDYVTDALDLVVRPDDIAQFAINRPQIEKALHLKPALHAQMVKLVADILKEANLIGSAFSTQNAAELFDGSTPKTMLAFGKRTRTHDPARLTADAKAEGMFSVPKRLESQPLRVVIINTLADDVDDFMEAAKRSLEKDFNLSLEVVRERKMRVISQTNLESAVRLLQKETSDLVLVFLPDEADSDEEEDVNERTTRVQTIGRGLPCLMIHESTMNRPEMMLNVVLGLAARAGALPYVLTEPLPYADRVVGLSLTYHNKREGDFLTGVTRIYNNDGSFMRSIIAGAPVNDGIPDELLARLFPRDLLQNKRILIHSDGRLKRDAQRALGSWEDELNATFLPVEVIRAGVPRMYAINGGKIEPPRWGGQLRLGENDAFVQTSDISVQPLHVHAEEPLTIEQATHSLLMFTLFHYGSIKAPKLPVTVHNADFIETGILRGVFPTEVETDIPFWL